MTYKSQCPECGKPVFKWYDGGTRIWPEDHSANSHFCVTSEGLAEHFYQDGHYKGHYG